MPTHRISDLLDLPRLQEALDDLCVLAKLPAGVIDDAGNVVVRSCWQDVCLKFHRARPETERLCFESTAGLGRRVQEGNPSTAHRCPFGLANAATPVQVEGERVGSVFTCQLFLSPPDLDGFRAQARRYGFDEESYLAAVRKVPVVTQAVVDAHLRFLAEFTGMLADVGLKRRREQDAERAREATIELLRICNGVRSLEGLMRELMGYFRRITGCEAVGVRLRDGNDFPYFETWGFPEDFVLAENHLCATDQERELVRQDVGHPALDCMCGNVLCGRFDPSKPFFSARGSFWSSCTTELLATTSDSDRQAKTRNRCNGEGYESVALIPLRSQDETFGLFQFNDRRRGRFTAEKIALLEDLVTYVAIALAKLKTDEELVESSRFNDQVVRNSVEGIIVYGRDLRYRLWNPYMERLGGRNASEVLGKSPLEVFPFLRETRLMERLERALAGETSTEEFPVENPLAGSASWASDTSGPLRNAKGEIVGVLGIARDITDRKRSESDLYLARFWIDRTSTNIIRVALDGTILDVNESMCRDLGYTRDELLRMTVHDIDPPTTRDRWQEEFRYLRTDGVKSVESAFRRKDGTTYPVEVNVSRLEYEGTEFLVAFVHDITERRRAEDALRSSEKRYRSLFENMLEGFAYCAFLDDGVSPDFAFLDVNEAFGTLTGLRDVLGKRATEIVPGIRESNPDLFEICGRVSATGRPERFETFVEPLGLWLSASVYSPEKGSFVTVFSDITERRRLEEQLRQSQKMEAVGRLAGGVAHDFNNLLTVINGYSDLLLEKVGEQSVVHRDLEEIRHAGEKAEALTRQLLAFSRRQVLQPKVLDVNGVISNVERMLHRLIGEDIELRTDLASGLWPISADPGQLEQVLLNLAVNARDAMPSGGMLTLSTANVDLDRSFAREHPSLLPGPHVLLVVGDTGMGIRREIRDHIFEPFFTTKEKGKGTGLGLATVYGIVKQSSGFIDVSSEIGEGTTFKIYFPRFGEEVGELSGPSKAASLEGGETVLLVEDEPSVREIVERTLSSKGYRVLPAGGGNEALQISGEYEGGIDLLITDVVMPGMGGRELADRIERSRTGIRVLFMSGYPENAISHHGVLEEGIEFLQKPFTPDGLLRKAREVLER